MKSTALSPLNYADLLERHLAGMPDDLAIAVAASRMVFRVAHLLEARIDAVLAPHGIDMREYLALILIADASLRSLRPSDLSTTLDATRTQITRLLDGLERKGLAQRVPGPDDRRSLHLAQTPAAKALLKRVSSEVHGAYRDTWRSAGSNGARHALTALRQVHAHLDAGEPT